MRFRLVHDLDVPAADAWAVLADYALDPHWRAEVVSMVPTPPGPVTVGTTTLEEARSLGSTFTTPGRVTAVDPGRSFAFEARSNTLSVVGRREVRPLGADRCQVVLDYDVRMHGAMKAMMPVMGPVFRRTVRANVDRLAELLGRRAGAEAA